MQIGILGQGFAMYGYLPALVELNYDVYTLDRYRANIESRVELHSYLKEITFVNSEQNLIDSSQSLLIAKRPVQQLDIVRKLNSRYSRVFLEKPLAPSLFEHKQSLDLLANNKVNFSVGYIFYLTDWFAKMSTLMKVSRVNFIIKWNITKPPISWKSKFEEGGGLGSFYAIHFVQVLKLLGFKYEVVVNLLEDSVSINGFGNSGSSIAIEVKFSSVDYFKVTAEAPGSSEQIIYSESSPVGPRSSAGMRDSRVELLKSYIKDTSSQSSNSYSIELEQAVLEFRTMLENGLIEARSEF